ncbi:ester cyclase [Acinetobacter sp. MD2(2019)]|uniref:ester cyclase n=1 Tax=Acinetobacter sp. MD2(2019) TaxID=2605273 RepID=UPI002D7809A9|nr:ester cyclase [Acinetobacter sp. MD2(2019)]
MLKKAIYLLPLCTFINVAHAELSPNQVITAYMSAWNAHDVKKAASYLDKNAVYYDVTVGTPQKGQAAARDKVIGVFIHAVPNLKWEMTSAPIVSRDGIAFQWRFSGKNTGAWNPQTPATGKPLSFEGVSFVRIQHGKITYQGDYYDAASLNKQMGW